MRHNKRKWGVQNIFVVIAIHQPEPAYKFGCSVERQAYIHAYSMMVVEQEKPLAGISRAALNKMLWAR
ncbi:hypothetical protein HR52_20045 [Aeromonas hydrophila]|nr:hypothetical protein HR52_20045 [Aeromonas hydrophila]OCA65369.1 hypothetical protein A9R12_13260 [Aeromonas hydrophila]OCY04418.1 hypothetical protein A9X69_18380 [Aeromonas hydrophila]OCY04617.1 hypothetical protein A9X70_18855 [Aeromonas hydrophila]TNI63213.1 hypothetical protein CF124_19880 [Aeromonas hydrophila]